MDSLESDKGGSDYVYTVSTTLALAASSLDVDVPSQTDIIEFDVYCDAESTGTVFELRFNDDSGASSYEWNLITGITLTVDPSDNAIRLAPSSTNVTMLTGNIDGNASLGAIHLVTAHGVNSAAVAIQSAGGWNDASAITKISIVSSNNMKVGSKIVIRGRNY